MLAQGLLLGGLLSAVFKAGAGQPLAPVEASCPHQVLYSASGKVPTCLVCRAVVLPHESVRALGIYKAAQSWGKAVVVVNA